MYIVIRTIVALSVLCVAITKPVSQDRIRYVSDVTATHFGNSQDFKDINIPSKQDTTNNHPHFFNLTNDGSGNYYFQFDTFGLQRYEIGEVKNAGTENEIQVVRGQYIDRYVNEDGVHVIRNIGYVADENGYRPFVISINFVLSQPAGGPGAPGGQKTEISSAALGSLVGGGLG
ncbi:hypothetical protein Zmor_015328 [Zophobas morio]|uniref:Uncharacterized protein n=1 Tax=Zophobas morio TaxID=2755281 RepID=A0AA38IGD1_9CUCU|nr:hypothetical protein Zmor_015328 [Zophobas morio]